jgi:hypothetical protein
MTPAINGMSVLGGIGETTAVVEYLEEEDA